MLILMLLLACKSHEAVLIAANGSSSTTQQVMMVATTTQKRDLQNQSRPQTEERPKPQLREFKAYAPPPLETKHRIYDYIGTELEREPYMIICCTHSLNLQPDRLIVIDLNPESAAYQKVSSELIFPQIGDELCKMNWTRSAANLGEMAKVSRSHLLVPCMASNRIYIVSVEGLILKLVKVIETKELTVRDLSCPYSVHTLPLSGAPIHVACLGDRHGHGKGDFLLIDRKTFTIRERINKSEFATFGGEFALQTRFNAIISCEWGHPRQFQSGLLRGDFNESDSPLAELASNDRHSVSTLSAIKTLILPQNPLFGNRLNVWQISPGLLKQTIDLDPKEGSLTTCIRFLHNPDCNHAFACSALGSTIYHVHMNSLSGEFKADKIIQLPRIRVSGSNDPLNDGLPAMLTDLVISMDDKFLYVAAWLHGMILQYDISDPFKGTLFSKVQLGGILQSPNSSRVTGFDLGQEHLHPIRTIIKDCAFRGGPASLQLSLDGRRLYVGNSFYKPWDAQFYPELIVEGGQIVLVEISAKDSTMQLSKEFLVDFGKLSDGPFLPRDARFPQGDSTSDNFL
ncbi:unnamed protein product, partial [Mesorhabditis belari]|uniref:Methanethiol oxidase n=1 Tax=Mesorhabditis belari TaxID=2138241 RepID=A0AAF3ELL0_9BILA